MTVAEHLRRAVELENISTTPRLDIEVLLCHVLEKPRSYLFAWPDEVLSEQQEALFSALLDRRKKGEPVAHLTGVREFWSLPLQVNSSTLIPRPDTELLVEAALQLPLPEQAHVVDLGTGTGAIALALASEKPHWKIVAADVQPDAVALAESNRAALGFKNVSVVQSNWFEGLADQTFDLIVSNPPYIDPLDPHLSQGDVRFEPRTALVAENNGLADIEIIASGAMQKLNAGGWLVVEHGYDQGEAVRKVFSGSGFTEVATRQDLSGNDRISLGRVAG
ncbi:peptide chain release factor N(5)-glutamine methyltransferase [Porticoccaceae bacterium LTM1]|nr:peptide chain release factor N(5)-glutamine methyltransferase [Porticoccaceae bacterium LTM1]